MNLTPGSLYFMRERDHVTGDISAYVKIGLTRERVRQIKEKALRRLRKSSKSKILKAYLG
jgi:DNA-directed RNA polymerase sigma subunit (sigma70/sigma32)